jgi:hypothetical protein
MVISEILVPKVRPVYQGMSGYYCIFILAGMWIAGQNKRKEQFILAYSRGTSIACWVMTGYCFLFRPVLQGAGYDYPGAYPNPNPFALYMVFMAANALYGIYTNVISERTGGNWRSIACMAEFSIAFFFALKSGSRASTLFIPLLMVIGTVFVSCHRTGRLQWRKLWGSMVTLVVLSVVMYPVLGKALNIIPEKIDHAILFDADEEYYGQDAVNRSKEDWGQYFNEKDDTDASVKFMSAGGSEESLIEKLLRTIFGESRSVNRILSTLKKGDFSSILGIRKDIYAYGIQNMNFEGHENGIVTASEEYTAGHLHNNALQIGYVYGYPAMIAYGIIVVYTVIRLICNKEKMQNKIWFFMIVSAYIAAYTFESGCTIVRDVMMIPFLLIIGMMCNKMDMQKNME